MDLQLTAKRALVTGGSRGIGKAVARALLDEGCAVALAARAAGPLEVAAAELRATTGGTAVAVPADTGVDESVRAMVIWTTDALGGVDILVNCVVSPAGQARRRRPSWPTSPACSSGRT